MTLNDDHDSKDIEYHDAIAAQYDRVVVEPRQKCIDALLAPARRYLPHAKRSMLDIGTGTGHMLARYAGLFESVTAIDHSAGMLDVAQGVVKRNGWGHVELQIIDAASFLERETRQFDFVSCVGFLHHLQSEQLVATFRGIRKVLAKNGVFLLAEPVHVDAQEPAPITWWNRKYRELPRIYDVTVDDPDEAPLQIEVLHDALRRAGLKRVGEGQGWEIFPRHDEDRLLDRVIIHALHALYGKSGFVYWACCQACEN